jgi:hypothetical protein
MRARPGVGRVGAIVLAASAIAAVAAAQGGATGAASPPPYAPVGLFFGAIEEGARIFTPTRLLPLEHPEAGGHEFPTAQRLMGAEFPLLIWLGERAGYRLRPTLQRYPTEPAPDWPYPALRAPPDTLALRDAPVVRRAGIAPPLPGLRAALFDGAELVAFIVDTRGLSLAERGMRRETSMGLDLTRADFLARVRRAAPDDGAPGLRAVVFAP